VLTPRTRVRFVKATDTADEVITAAGETGHSRFPVIGEDSDDVLGLVHLKRAVSVPRQRRSTVPISDLTVSVPVGPESMPLDSLLDLLRERGFQLAVVADEYGGTAGLLTLEDVVEELVGEITDEHDPKARRAERLPDRTWLLPGSLRPDEVAEITGVLLPDSANYETLAGLILDDLGRLAQIGDFIVVTATVRHTAALGVRQGTPQRSTDPEPGPTDRAARRSVDDPDAVRGPAHHPAGQTADPIEPDEEQDLPRAAWVRLDVMRIVGHRIDLVQLSAVGLREDS
jgi:Mg2+/Co2+ transporter CorC